MKKIYQIFIFCLILLSIFTSCEDKTQGTELVTITLDSGLLAKEAETVETVKDKSVILPSGDSLWKTDAYTFSGWAVAKDGEAEYKAGDKYSSSADITLYAVWNGNTTITYNPNGGTGNIITESYKAGDQVTIKSTNFTKEGYTLSYWSTSIDASDTYTIGQEITLTENLTLYAIWVENKDAVTISFNSGTVEGDEQSISSTEGQEIILPAGDSFWSSDQYSFSGWATTASGTVEYKAGVKYSVTATTTLYAVWEANPTITYKANGGNGKDITEYYKKGSSVVIGNASFTKDDHTLSGWSTTSSGSVTYTIGQKVTLSDNLTLYAIWVENKDAVTISFNSGTVTGKTKSISATEGQEIILPAGDSFWSSDWYSFSGWTTTASGIVEYKAGVKYSVKETTTLYAVWEANPKITYKANGGTGEDKIEYYKKGSKVIIKNASFAKADYTFSSWSTTEVGTGGTTYTLGQEIEITENIILYARWVETKNAVTVSFDSVKGIGNTKSISAVEGQEIILPSGDNLWTTSQYSFSGWATEENGKVQYCAGAEYTVKKDEATLYAVWEANPTITYNPNGGTGAVITEYHRSGDKVTIKGTNFKKDGFTLSGWSESSNGSVTYTIGQEINLTEDLTLYAVWTEKMVTITYLPNGGSGSIVTNTVKAGATIEINGTSTTFSRDGYSFSGWGTSPDETETIISDLREISFDSDKTFYAIWKENRSIKYYADGRLVEIVYPTGSTVIIGNGNGLTKDNYALYWTTSSDGYGTSYDIGEEYTDTDSIVLYARWQEDNGDLTYTLDRTSKTYSVKASRKNISGVISIPSTYKEKKVTSIEELAFENCTAITSIVIPDTVTSIGGGAFYGCSSLASINIPKGVEELKTYIDGNVYNTKGLFAFCYKLRGVSLQEGVKDIGDNAFYSCTSLESISLPDSVTSIRNNAFYGCTKLKSAKISKNAQVIGDYAFAYCNTLTSVKLSTNLIIIGEKAFEGCAELKSIEIPSSVTSIGNAVFLDCGDLTVTIFNIKLEKGTWELALATSSSYYYPLSINLVIEDDTDSIGTQFQNCSTVVSISIPSTVTSIEENAFKECSSLTEITIKNTSLTSEKSWGATNANYKCGNFKLTTDGVLTASEGHDEFTGDIVIPSKIGDRIVTAIGGKVFADSSLSSITIPDCVESIGTLAFGNCTSLTQVKIPASVATINSDAFSECGSLTSIKINRKKGSITDTNNNNWGASSATVCWKISNVDDTITLGTVTWKALAVDSEKKRALLISHDILEKRLFDNEKEDYKSSAIRNYLLSDEFFSNYGLKKDYMVNVDVTTSIETTTVGSGSDYVFLLSNTEAEQKYFANNGARIANFGNDVASWWLRKQHGNDWAITVSTEGILDYNTTKNNTSGLRPAFWYTWE